MARAATSKTRAVEKSKPITSQTPAATTQDIVAGKFNEADWNTMLEKDGSEEFVAEIVDEIIQLSMDAIYEKYIDRQLLPYTITQARDAILEIIQWQFLARDEGEQTLRSNPGWLEDAEPEPAETDCWAQGSMPKSIIVVEPEPLQKIPETPEEEAHSEVSVTLMQGVPQEPAELADTVSDAEETPHKSVGYAKEDVAEPDSRHQEVKFDKGSRKISLRKKSKTPPDHEIKRLSGENKEAVDKVESPQKNPTTCSSYIKTLLVRPTGTKDAVYDEFGTVLAVSKLDPEKLPTHKVNVKFTIADPTKDTELKMESKKKNQASVKHKAKGVQAPTETPNKVTQSKVSQMTYDKTPTKSAATPRVSITVGAEEDFPQRRSMIEEIEVSQGIIVRENGRTKKGPGRYYRKLDILEEGMKGMKPVSLRITNPGITVADLLDRQSPILHAYRDTPPLPPIARHASQQAKQMS